jgi:hypothetical protein
VSVTVTRGAHLNRGSERTLLTLSLIMPLASRRLIATPEHLLAGCGVVVPILAFAFCREGLRVPR